MKELVLQSLSTEDLLTCNGGHVPMAWYMDSDSIEANGSFAKGFWSSLYNSLF